MNSTAAVIAAGIGGAFFAVASLFPYRPEFIKTDAIDLLTTDHSKARTAVSRLLINPMSAEFAGLRSVEVEKAKYVCGTVKAKDKGGAAVGARAFVYTVAIDFARIDDDDGRIAQRHAAYRACPMSEEEVLAKQQKMEISPRALEIAKVVQKGAPTSDTSALTGMSSQLSSSASSASGGGRAAGPGTGAGTSGSGGVSGSASAGRQSEVAFKATRDNEDEWRADRPPAAWPAFPPDHALGRPGLKRASSDAIAAARTLEDRWAQFKAGTAKRPPSTAEINEVQRSLLAVDPQSDAFPQAWAAFVRLRKLEKQATA